jgi:uncharacterized lipoprotein YddW (UPF0748 family)
VFLPLAGDSQGQWPTEARALWVTRWDYTTPDDVTAIMERAAAAHFNIVFFQVRGNADAFYQSQFEPWAQRLTRTLGQDPGWDPLALAVQEAHARGLQLHAYINVYPAWVGTAPPPLVSPEPMFLRFNRLYGDSWVQWHEDGTPMALNASYLWASPGHPAVAEHIRQVAADVVGRYAVDGLHLDNVRYAGPAYSHDPVSTARFAQEQTEQPWLTWEEWQRRQVSELVGSLHTEAHALRTGVWVTGAVWPVYHDEWDWWSGADGYDGYYQDSLGWLANGQIDAICPMLYGTSISPSEDHYRALLEDFAIRAAGRSVLAGITADYEDFSAIARRIALARELGTAGQAIFSIRYIDQHAYWDEFLAGPYAQPALVAPQEE